MTPILCLDFDGVLHSYTSGWRGADVVPDPPVPGAMEFIERIVEGGHFRLAIHSSRSHQGGGIAAMGRWLEGHLGLYFGRKYGAAECVRAITYVRDFIDWPTVKPPATVTIDDRAITFTGEWPSIETLLAFQPWNKAAIKPLEGP